MTQPTRPPTARSLAQPLRTGPATLRPCSGRALWAALLLAGCSATLEGSAPTGAGEGLPQRDDASMGQVDAATVPSRDAGSDGGTAPAPDDAGGCHAPGRFAIRVAFDVAWAGTTFAGVIPIISPGEGELSFIVLADMLHGAGKSMAVAQACAAHVPDFVSSLPQERYAAQFVDPLWDSPLMPRFAIATHYGCFEPGCTINTEAIYAQLGSQLATPSATWPMRASGGSWPDHDQDQRRGITVRMRGPTELDKQGRAYAYPPVTPLLIRRVSELSLGLRIGLTLQGELDGCDRLQGDAPMGSIDTRAIECVAADSGDPCNADELAFLDDNLPIWTVRGGSFRGIRVDDTADCAAARGAFP